MHASACRLSSIFQSRFRAILLIIIPGTKYLIHLHPKYADRTSLVDANDSISSSYVSAIFSRLVLGVGCNQIKNRYWQVSTLCIFTRTNSAGKPWPNVRLTSHPVALGPLRGDLTVQLAMHELPVLEEFLSSAAARSAVVFVRK